MQGDSERAKEIALALQKKMDELEREMRYAAAKRVAEDFKDPLGPLNALTAATMAPPGTCCICAGFFRGGQGVLCSLPSPPPPALDVCPSHAKILK